MKFIPSDLPGVTVIEPTVFGDQRGFFMETFHAGKFAAAGIDPVFVQQNHSRSAAGTLRGLHFQEPRGQGKLVRVIAGAILDVAVDVRRGSPAFGRWMAIELSAENRRQLWIPAGFAHGFAALSDCEVLYSCTELYAPECERTIAWNDPDLAIDWPAIQPILSPRDAAAPRLRDAPILPEMV